MQKLLDMLEQRVGQALVALQVSIATNDLPQVALLARDVAEVATAACAYPLRAAAASVQRAAAHDHADRIPAGIESIERAFAACRSAIASCDVVRAPHAT
ncbi:MAG: hypothetical protein U1A27_07650 [Phycisphaerae bacterium]